MLDRLHKSTAQTDLKIIGIDEDSKPGAAPDFLKRREYDWEDFHFNKSVISQLLTSGVSLIVLVDLEGTIVYYHTGTDPDGLVRAVTRLGPAYAGATIDR